MKKCLATILFIAIFALTLNKVSDILEFKSLSEPWNMTLKVGGFYNEPDHSMDVMFFGSSHMYCSINPLLLKEETGLESYIFASQQQPLWISYHYIKEALKSQSPSKIFLEIHMATFNEEYTDEGTNYSAIDPIPFSVNKMAMIYAAAPKGERHEYLFNIIKYHGRWAELKPQDYDLSFKEKTDPYRGYVKLTEIIAVEDWDRTRPDLSQITESTPPTDKNLQYLNKIIDLAKERKIELAFFKTPSNATAGEKKIYNYIAALCQERDVEFVDFNMHAGEIGLDAKSDFYDRNHLNVAGVEKFLPYFISYFDLSTAELDL